MTFIAGAFNATFNGKFLGTTEDGFEMTFNRIQEEIRVDQYRGIVDGVFQGIDMTLRTVLMEADYEVLTDILFAFDNDQDGVIFTGLAAPPATNWDNDPVGNISRMQGTVPNSTGQLLSKMARPLVLTPCGGTTAKINDLVGNAPLATITFAKAVLTVDPVTMSYAAKLRKIPLAFHILPDWSSSDLPLGMPVGSFRFDCGKQLQYFVRAA